MIILVTDHILPLKIVNFEISSSGLLENIINVSSACTIGGKLIMRLMFFVHIFKNKKCLRNIYAPTWCKIQVYLLCRSKICPKQVSKGLKYMKWTTQWAQEWFDLDLCDLEINRDHLLIKGNPYTRLGIDQVKGSKDIERTTLGLQTDRPIYRQLQNNMPPFTRGHKNFKLNKLFKRKKDIQTNIGKKYGPFFSTKIFCIGVSFQRYQQCKPFL